MLNRCLAIVRRALIVLACGAALFAASAISSAQAQSRYNVWFNRNAQSPSECFTVKSARGQPAYPRAGGRRAYWHPVQLGVSWLQAWAIVEQQLIQMASRRNGCGFGTRRHAAAVQIANQMINEIRRDRQRAGQARQRGVNPYALGEMIGRSLGEMLGGRSSRGGHHGSRPSHRQGSGHGGRMPNERELERAIGRGIGGAFGGAARRR